MVIYEYVINDLRKYRRFRPRILKINNGLLLGVDMNNQETNILPCPFCGGIPSIEKDEWYGDTLAKGYYVECRNNECQCEPRTWSEKELTEDEAIAQWNKRA